MYNNIVFVPADRPAQHYGNMASWESLWKFPQPLPPGITPELEGLKGERVELQFHENGDIRKGEIRIFDMGTPVAFLVENLPACRYRPITPLDTILKVLSRKGEGMLQSEAEAVFSKFG